LKNTSISLGHYFDQFVGSQVSSGRYKNVSEVTRAKLRLLENEESKALALRNAIHEGVNSSLVEDFYFDENLQKLKAKKEQMVKIIFRQEAIDDLNYIWDYTYEKWSEK